MQIVTKMIKTNLLEKYPDLIDKCRQWDCSFSEGIKKLEEENKDKGKLTSYL